MVCKQCRKHFEHDDLVVVIEKIILHEVECFSNYMLENCADECNLTYLEYLENALEELKGE